MRRLLFPLTAVGVLLAACGPAPDPQISFNSGRDTINVLPLQYCDTDGENCHQDGNNAGSLQVKPNSPVQISVDEEIAESPWQVEYRVLDQQGKLSVGCSDLLTKDTFAYTVPAQPDGTLTMINVFQAGGRATADSAGFQVFARGSWTVLVNGNKTLPKPGEILCPPRKS